MRDTDLRQPAFSRPRTIFLWLIVTLLSASALAQSGDREARAALWEGYKIPNGGFVRFVDRQKGFSFWHPAGWQERAVGNGNRFFHPAPQGINLFVMTEEIPDGYGVANYASNVLQGLRNQPVGQDSVTVRRVMLGGLEWREIAYNIEPQGGGQAHQTMWFTAVGPRVYGFVLSVAADRLEQDEPLLKRIVASVRIGAAGHWDEEFETLRVKFTTNAPSNASYEIEAAAIAEGLRTARQSPDAVITRVAELFGKAPAAALDLLTDADPQVRTAAITALGRVRQDEAGNDALVWALSDLDVFASTAAARALAARGAAGLAAIKSKIPVPQALRPEAMVRGGLAFSEQAANELIAELLRTDSANDHLGALQLALAMPRLDVALPVARLLASPNLGVRHATVAVLQQHRQSHAMTEATAELLKLLRGDNEDWAARALGEVAPMAVAAELDKRIAEIDARLTALGKPKPASGGKMNRRKPGNPPPPRDDTADALAIAAPADLKTKPEDVRLAIIRGQLETAARKIRFRGRWDTAKDEAARRAITAEIRDAHSDLIDWAQSSLFRAAETERPIPAVNAARLAGAPTTGETLFPKSTVSYVMAPNFAAMMERLDAALSGVQMATVRDQMTFALVLKLLKAGLAEKTGASVTGDAAKAIGVDLKSPMALATWAADAADGKKNAATRSAVVARVLDRTRFERLLATYQEELGDLNSFATITAAAARFAGVIPAAMPVIFAALEAEAAGNAVAQRIGASSSRPAAPSLKPFAWVRQERLGDLPVTILNKPAITQSGGVRWETVYLAYFGETAVIASSRSALADVVATGLGEQASVAQNEAFKQLRGAQSGRGQAADGEMVFFSDLPALLQTAFGADEGGADKSLQSFLKVFGAETGALHISPTSWDTHFRVRVAENDFTSSFKPFKADVLAAPRDLLPKSTVLYAGAVVDPPKLLAVLKRLDDAGSAPSSAAQNAKPGASGLARDKELDEVIEKQLVPQMNGEIGAAVISFKPIFDNGDWPATVFAARLQGKALAEAMRAGRLFAKFNRVPNATALGSSVVALGEDGGAPFVAVTDDYFLLADSLETLKSLESKEKFSASRDFARSLAAVPDRLALFATYNLEAAFEEAGKALDGKESQRMLPFLSALVHAFHSQRGYVTLEQDGQAQTLNGRLLVSFDREGRYSVGDLARGGGDFDVANAIIATRGLTIIQSPRVEAMTLRVTAQRAGVAPRVRDDLAKFPWQRIEPNRDAGNDTSFVITTTARHIPADLTVRLPVAGSEFAPFLNPTAQINSKAPEVVALAKQIAGDDKDGHSVARKIGDWTYQNLKWKKVESDVVDTLASREADCLEHAELYVALARALGLPARVVTGAALSGGSFGSHAWVEIYLGRWVELDPTWGLMEHVDATHLRFDGDAFTSYAMLNQLDLEITAARRAVADFQRDPVRLVKEFSLNAATRDLAFDLPLTVKQTIGETAWDKLDERQRAAVIKSFERTVKGLWETWKADMPEPVRVLRRQQQGDRAVLTVLRGEALLRLTLARRDGAWFITEHEIVDDALPEFADALAGALRPEARRGRIYEVSFDAALNHLDRIIAAEGEKPELLLLKARVVSVQQSQQRLEQVLAAANQENAPPTEKPAPPAEEKPARGAGGSADELWQRLTTRWPDFAQGHLARGRDLLNAGDTEESLAPISKDTAQAVASLQRYAQLVPDDPRPWRELAQAYEQMEKFAEAERAYRAAIERDRTYLDHHAVLVNFLLDREDLEKAKVAFAEMLKAAPDPDDVFAYLDDEEGFDADEAKLREELLAAFPKEVAASKTALSLLAGLQEAQNKLTEAVRSTQRAIAIEPEADDYETLSRLYRKQRRFPEALSAADQALKLDDSAISIQFERACSLAQLGRKREAVAALKQLAEGDQPFFFDADEPDLQPLATMPEFKALKEKMKEAGAPPTDKEEKEEKEGAQPKPGKAKEGKP